MVAILILISNFCNSNALDFKKECIVEMKYCVENSKEVSMEDAYKWCSDNYHE